VCLSVFPHDISNTDAGRITKPDIEIFHDESWKPIYFGVKRSKVNVTRHKIIAGMGFCECWLVLIISVNGRYGLIITREFY